MDGPKSSILRSNLLYLLGGQTVSFIINFFSILLAARYLGVSDFGSFANLLAIVTIISKIIDFGLGPILFRELSKDAANHKLLSAALTLKIFISLVVILLSNIFFKFLSFNIQEIILLNSLFITVFISSRMANFREILSIPFKVSHSMSYPMFFNVLDNILLLLGVILMPFLKVGIEYFIIIYIVSNLPSFFLLLVYLSKNFHYKFKMNILRHEWLIRESLPLAGFVLLNILFQQMDILFLNYLKNPFDTGVFAASVRLTMPLSMIPASLITIIFPLIVRNIINNNPDGNEQILRLTFRILFLISFTFAIIISFKIDLIVNLIFGGDYEHSTVPTILLAWSQVFLFYNFFALDLLTAINMQKWNFFYSSLIVILNLSLDFWLIPKYSFVGAALAKFITAFIGTFFIVFILKKYKLKFNFLSINIVGWAGLSIGFTYLISFLPVIVYLIICPIIIVFLALKLQFFKREELNIIINILNFGKWSTKIFRYLL